MKSIDFFCTLTSFTSSITRIFNYRHNIKPLSTWNRIKTREIKSQLVSAAVFFLVLPARSGKIEMILVFRTTVYIDITPKILDELKNKLLVNGYLINSQPSLDTYYKNKKWSERQERVRISHPYEHTRLGSRIPNRSENQRARRHTVSIGNINFHSSFCSLPMPINIVRVPAHPACIRAK